MPFFPTSLEGNPEFIPSRNVFVDKVSNSQLSDSGGNEMLVRASRKAPQRGLTEREVCSWLPFAVLLPAKNADKMDVRRP